MDKLTKPSKSIEDFYLDLIAGKRNNEKNNFLKNRLNDIKDLLVLEEKKYIESATNRTLYTFKEHSIIEINESSEVVIKDEMESLYEQDFVSKPSSGKIGREIYDYLKSLALDETCPYCSVTKVSTIDHYLPKVKFPKFAVTPANLVPCCRDCNSAKGDKFYGLQSRMFIHPYFEDVGNFIWLKCTVVEGFWPINFRYEVEVLNDSNKILYQRICNQYNMLDLYNILSNKANRFFRYRIKSIIKNYKVGGINLVIEYLQEAEESCKYVDLNSWEACMYNALLNSTWFLTEAIEMIEEKYQLNI